jgi:hypothetical protein
MLGSTSRPLCTEDPAKDTCLPCNDQAWDSGVCFLLVYCYLIKLYRKWPPPERVYLSSPTDGVASPFARLAQASHLLGRVIRHVDDTLSPEDTLREIKLLSDALFSLVNLIKTDSIVADGYWPALSICFRYPLPLSMNKYGLTVKCPHKTQRSAQLRLVRRGDGIYHGHRASNKTVQRAESADDETGLF